MTSTSARVPLKAFVHRPSVSLLKFSPFLFFRFPQTSSIAVIVAELTLYLYAAVQGTERIGGWGILLFVGHVVFYLACIVYLSFLKEEVQKQEKKRTEITETA